MYMRLAPLLWGETRSMQKSVISPGYAPCSCMMWCTVDSKVMVRQLMRGPSLLKRDHYTGHSLHHYRIIMEAIYNALLLHLKIALWCRGRKYARRLCEAPCADVASFPTS